MIFINKLDRYGSDPFLARILRVSFHDHERSVTEVDVDVFDVDVDINVVGIVFGCLSCWCYLLLFASFVCWWCRWCSR